MSQGTEFHGRGTAPAHPGRHRRGGAESWTPPLPQHRPVRHHAAGATPAEPPAAGSAPLWQHAPGGAPEPGLRYHAAGAGSADQAPHSWHHTAPAGSARTDASLYYADPGPNGSHPSRQHTADAAHGPASLYYADPGPNGSHPPRQHTAYPAHGPAMTDASLYYAAGPGSGGWAVTGTPPSWHHAGGTTPAMTGSASLRHHTSDPAHSGPAMAGSHPLRRHDAGPASLPHHPYDDPGEVGTRPFRHCAGDSGPADPPASGSLPLPQPSLPQPRDRRLAQPLFPASHGSLPLDDFDDLREDDEPESRADQAARRTRVSLAAPAPRRVDLDEDDVRVYSAPPLDGLGGLGGFAIGSVPASVTPPKTWRKAAWFATGASGAVVVGLLCAGSFLVGKPSMDQAVQGAWPGYQGVPTIADPTDDRTPPTEGGSAAGPETASRPENAAGTTRAGGGGGPVDGVAPPHDDSDDSAAASETAPTGHANPSTPPRKPPVTPAQRETPVKSPWWYSFPPDAQTMGDNSEKFFNTVTTDPAAASSVTTGQLHDQGPQALAQRYAGIAYFEVKKVSIDQQRGVTVNTVEVTHTDGSKTLEERTLTFGDGDKITADGQ
ncbi:hypothetical protein [Amycolatopsis sp.]|uniref:hypothetical protein n=1 Tax=Amycolatopsis sp. TaxID=37632 RepID=UPI002D80DF13|nr:hypothetical protein [Amycolatopsis sp.]HET6712078.1 hypothetical protein [Amycolatopsis sp.]